MALSTQRSTDRAPAVSTIPLDVEQRDRAWMERVRAGDYDTFDAIFCTFGAPLCAYVNSLIHAPDEAEDLIQELFLSIWEHRREWVVPGSLTTYLYRSARNRGTIHLPHRQVE